MITLTKNLPMGSPIQILPGIKSIGWLDCRKLHRFVGLLSERFGELAAVNTTVNRLRWFSGADCRRECGLSEGRYSEKSTLRFSTDEAIPDGVPLGFVVETPDGDLFLIGSREPPFPTVSVTRTAGSPGGDSAGFIYEISHVGLRTMVPCLAWF